MFHSSCNVSSMCFPCASFKCDGDDGKRQCRNIIRFCGIFVLRFRCFLFLQIVLCIVHSCIVVWSEGHYVRMNTIPNRRRAFETFSLSHSLWIRIACTNVIVFANKFCIVRGVLPVCLVVARAVCLFGTCSKHTANAPDISAFGRYIHNSSRVDGSRISSCRRDSVNFQVLSTRARLRVTENLLNQWRLNQLNFIV